MELGSNVMYNSKYPPPNLPQKLQGKTIVLKYGGAALERRETEQPIIKDIATIQQYGACVVVVHGGSRQMDDRMRELGLEIRSVGGLRYTCDRTIEEAKTIFGQINAKIVEL